MSTTKASAERIFSETPQWAGLNRLAVTFLFDLKIERAPRSGDAMGACRLESIARALDPDMAPHTSATSGAAKSAGRSRTARTSAVSDDLRRAVHAALVEPVASFHDDITTGGPGRGGRPLVFLARPEGAGSHHAGAVEHESAERILVRRPASWTYRAEGAAVEMRCGQAVGPTRDLTFELRDSFFVFESARIAYAFTLTASAEAASDLSEYDVMCLLKLVHPHFGAGALRAEVSFDAGDGPQDLVSLVASRITALGISASKEPNGVRDILERYVMQPGERIAAPRWSDLSSAVIGVDSAEVLAAYDAVAATPDFLERRGAPVLGLSERGLSSSGDTIAAHVPADHDPEAARALALAGVLQAVPDYPHQDSSEIWDSTRAVAGGFGKGFALFSHPRFLFEIAAGWRSLEDGRSTLGHCPYLLLTWVVAAHDEAIAMEMEEALDLLVYGGEQEALMRAEPLRDLVTTFERLERQFLPGPSAALRDSLARRLDVFRRLNIHRSRHIFRYEKESETLAVLNDKRGTSDRFARATEILDRYESLVEDVQEMGAMASDKRLNMFLAIVAGFTVVSALADLSQLGLPVPPRVALGALGAMCGLVLLWIALTKAPRR